MRDLLLAIETSTAHGSLALGRGDRLLAARTLSPERRHAGELLPVIHELLTAARATPDDVAVLAFSQGPGSFTGLRVAATVAQMWQSATGCRVVAVPTLEVLARNALACEPRPRRVAVMMDARQGRVFGAAFELAETGITALAPAGVCAPATWLRTLARPCAVSGDAVTSHRAVVEAAGLDVLPEEFARPDARQVLAIGRALAAAGRFAAAHEIVPLYLRPPECEEVYEQRRAEAKARRNDRG